MDKRIKNYLAIAIIISVLLIALSSVAYVKVYYKTTPVSSMRTFSVSGEGEVVAVPDVAKFSFGVVSEGGMDVVSIQEDNSTKINKTIEYLKVNGVEEKDIKTQNYNLSPRYEYEDCVYGVPCGRSAPKIIGYIVTQSISVKVRDFSKTGEILAGVVSEGANNVSGLSFEIDEPEELENEARDLAVKEAETKAKAIAKSAGFKVGRLVSINEGYSQPYYSQAVSFEATGKGIGGAVSSIEPGSQEVIVNISLVYEIR
ncbi:SIMPL domain-containing protein [Patescibacteria group bacterium]